MNNRSSLSIHFENLIKNKFFIFSAYLILACLFLAAGINIFKTALAPGDAGIFGVPTKVTTTGFELWIPYIQAGTFPYKDIGWQALYLPAILVMKIFPNLFGYNLLLLVHYGMAGFFTFLYLRKLKLNPVASFIGGIAFMFCGFLSAHKGHHSMLMAASYLPIVLFFFESYLNTRKLSGLFLTALAFGLSILADYTAVPMYIGMVLLPYILFRVLTGEQYREKSVFTRFIAITGISIVVFGGGLMIAAVEIIPVLESLKYVTREEIPYYFFASYSFSYKLLPLLIFPYIFGTQSPSVYQPFYFGPWNLTEMAGYMGILPLLFAALSFILFRRKNSQIYFWTAMALVAFLLVLGDSTPLYKLMYHVPIYNMFRASARNWLEVNFAIAVLSSYFIHYLISDVDLTRQRYLSAVSVVLVLLYAVITLMLASLKYWGFPPEMMQLLLEYVRIDSPAIYIPLIIVLFSSFLLYVLYQYRDRNAVWVIVAIALFLDLFSFGNFHDKSGFRTYKIFQDQPNQIADFLDASNMDKNQYRIFTVGTSGDAEEQLMPNMNLLYGFNIVNGYSNIWLKDYKDLTSFEANGIASKEYELLLNQKILSLLSTKYIITSDKLYKNFLQTAVLNTDPGENKVIIEGFKDTVWDFVSSTERSDQHAILKSDPHGQVSLTQTSFSLQPKTVYTIAFKARLKDGATASEPLIVDFFGDDYDSRLQEAWFDKAVVSEKFQDFTVEFYAGEKTPSPAYLRFFTTSNQAYEIADVKLIQNTKTSSRIPPLDDTSQLQKAETLYNAVYKSPAGVVYENPTFCHGQGL